MSQLSQDAHVVVFVADSIGIDSKVHALGIGFQIAGVQPTGFTAPQSVCVLIDFPGKYAGQEFALSIELRDQAADSVVQVPGQAGPEALRVQQMTRINPSVAPGIYLPPDMPCRVQSLMAFTNGLPLQAGRFYYWRVEIDGQHRKDWRAPFYVLAPGPSPVFGGPVGPSSVPNLPPPPVDPQD